MRYGEREMSDEVPYCWKVGDVVSSKGIQL